MIGYIALSANKIWDLAFDTLSGKDIQITALTEKVEYGIFTSSDLAEKLGNKLRLYALNALTSAGEYSLGKFAEVSVCSFEDLLKSCNIDLETTVKTELNIAENAFKKLTDPFGKTLSLLFTGNEYFDYMVQTSEICWSGDNPYITIYATNKDEFIEATMNGVTVKADQGVVDKGAVLQVFRIAYEDTILGLEGIRSYERCEVYDTKFTNHGEESRINGSVTVRIPLPDWFFGNNCIVLRQEADGTWTELETTVGPSFVEFQTDYFSLYAVVETIESNTLDDLPSSNDNSDPDDSLPTEMLQKKLLEDYAREQGFTNCVHFTDNGWSGANFDRPNWKRMIAGIESGEISHVLIKDLSRVGRDYLQVGFYTEVMFKERGVRFIAITNGVDSDRRESSEFAPFLNIINENLTQRMMCILATGKMV